jgi:predicted dehydrogenase
VVVGYGSIGKRHCKNLSKIKNIQCFVVTKQRKIQFPSKNFQAFESLKDCIKFQPDVGIVANESNLHIKTAIQLAKAGCHIFIEKPLSHNSSQISQLSKIVNQKNLITLMGCNFRFHPCLIKIKELLSSKKIGRILSVKAEHGSYLPDWHPNEDYKKSYASQKKLGGSVVLTSIHEIDYLLLENLVIYISTQMISHPLF